jgi:uncharacterized protein YcbK (DUF882 family)
VNYPNETHITEHFTWSEFGVNPFKMKSDDKTRLIAHCRNNLEPIRSHYRKPVHVTPEGGYRSFEEQAELYAADLARHGGKPSGNVAKPGSSRHNYGDASDIWIEGVAPRDLANFAATLPHVGGVGQYRSFVHVDARPVGAPGRPTQAVDRWYEQ